MTDNPRLREQFRQAYLTMAQKARYRPEAPSDGLGNVLLDEDELADSAILADEADRFADAFAQGDQEMQHVTIGCVHFPFAKAQVYLLEAAKLCCAGHTAAPTIRQLLTLAAAEMS